MRIRQVKPEFWKDPDLAKLPLTARLAYIGLWGLADDSGWFRFDVPSMALELFGYEPRTRRERMIVGALEVLVAAKRVEPHECGHALIPTLVDHQRFAGETKRVYTVLKEHKQCPRVPAGPPQPPAGEDDPSVDPDIPAGPRGSPRFPATVRNKERNVSVRQGQVDPARKRDDESESEFRLRAGLPAFMGGDA
ncbi:MAG: hypothetical protein HY331_10855 [Chloroflexi bacterium]|nr:hypothetical protein [Chloroflexota bacterium]